MIRDDTSRGVFEGGSYLPDRDSSCRAKRGTTNSDGRPSVSQLSSPPGGDAGDSDASAGWPGFICVYPCLSVASILAAS